MENEPAAKLATQGWQKNEWPLPAKSIKGLAVKIAEVIAAVGWVEKRGRNTQQNYDYATEADVLDAVRGELAKRKVVILPTVDAVERWDVQGQAKTIPVTRVWVTFLFVDGESGETLERRFPGDGMDSGDKGIYKAITGAEKYCLSKTFMLPAGDDPEKDDGDQKPKRGSGAARSTTSTGTAGAPASPSGAISPKQIEFFRTACQNQHVPIEDLCAEFSIESIADLPAADFNRALAFLKKAGK